MVRVAPDRKTKEQSRVFAKPKKNAVQDGYSQHEGAPRADQA